MKIGIVVYSQTGNTRSVGEKLRETLSAAGHSVSLEQIITTSKEPTKEKSITLKTVPEIGSYDVVLFGAPVWGFSICPVMRFYLSTLPPLDGKQIGMFVTQQLSSPMLGGNRAIRQMKDICGAKSGHIYATGVVNWSNKKREEQITRLVQNFSAL